ncbi:predicted protein [Naegleria gruberi]|uniref:Predicted protein n=1 Tax=Naegleria gruberi TaxID=5762 RepID=D2W0J9_NAEGR|nr:uncharacterized protein NAEGRDRAFT_74886 [Naegleria gruberi]EFC37441.1 predicted protein [Naegleria gruberi]|eukprot:XP_002670185.1 predicted protein [Naegleria gruberi strain NEG-M]
MAKKKSATEQNIRDRINPNDPDTTISFSLSQFPINDLLNNNSFIDRHPDVLDMIFYEPGIIDTLKMFNTCTGFVLTINSLKEVKIGNWLQNSVKKKSSENEMDQMLFFIKDYSETQIFNILLKNIDAIEDSMDPQEYFDEVARCCSEVIVKNVQTEKVKPQLFSSSVEYSIYAVSESINRNDVLDHRGINLTFSGNIGIEKSTGGFLKKGKINILLDLSVKVVVYNNYMFSKRGLTCVLNGMRDREGKLRQKVVDEDIERSKNDAVNALEGGKKDYAKKPSTFTGSLLNMVNEKVQDKVDARIEEERNKVLDRIGVSSENWDNNKPSNPNVRQF